MTIHRCVVVSMLAILIAATGLAGCRDEPQGSAAKPAPAFVFQNPLRDGEPGEWARYQWEQDKTMTLTFLQVDPISGEVRIDEEYRDPEKNALMGKDTLSLSPNHFLTGFDAAGARIQAMTFETIRVAGRDWPCLRLDFIGRAQGAIRVWYSDEAPVTGLVKQVRMDKSGEEVVSTLLVDWAGRQPVPQPGE